MEKVVNYVLSPEAMVMVSGSGIGAQRKYYENGFWYKQNNVGYEGNAEYLASLVLENSNIFDFVKYERCLINGKEGCVSKNFLKPSESYISIQRLYDIYNGGQLSEYLPVIEKTKGRITFVADFVYGKTHLDIKEYLGKMLTFDMLILNTDRHFNNFGIIVDAGKAKYKMAPIFDNGNSLLSNIGEFPFDLSISSNIEKVVGRPFSANLEIQAMEAGFGLKVNYSELEKKLDELKDSRALEVLHLQLEKYEKIIKDNNLVVESGQKKESVLDKLHQNREKVSSEFLEQAKEIQEPER